MARAGYAARAVVYGLVGIFAILLTFQEGGALTDTRGVLHRLMDQPFGKILLGAVAIGLFFFSAWRALQAIQDYDKKGSSPKGIAVRVGYGLSAFTYAALGFNAVNLIFHLTRQSGGGEKEIAQSIMGQSSLFLGLIGLIIVSVGFLQIYLAVKEKFKKSLDLPGAYQWLYSICKIGIAARGVVFCLMGWLFVRAAWRTSTSELDGLKGVWKLLAAQSYGSVLVGCMAFGLLAFSVYGFTQAAYRKNFAG